MWERMFGRLRSLRGTPLRGWRRIASGMWSSPDDPQIFGSMDIDAEPMLAFIENARRAGYHPTPTHLVGRALAHAFTEVPDLNVRIRRGRVRARDTVDVFFITAVDSGHDLSGVKIVGTERKSALEIADELRRRALAMKQGKDKDFAKTKGLTDRIPPMLLRPLLRVTAFLTQELRLDVPSLALQHEPFGSAMVSSVGMFGLPHGFAPLAWMYDVPVLLLVGEITDRAMVVGGRVVARKVLPIMATIDHRYVDGWHISKALKALREYLDAPQRFEPVLLTTAQERHA